MIAPGQSAGHSFVLKNVYKNYAFSCLYCLTSLWSLQYFQTAAGGSCSSQLSIAMNDWTNAL